MSIPRTSTRRPVAVAMLFLAVVLLGVISYVRLPIDLLPDVSYPRLVVFTSYPDVAPAEVERIITRRVENFAAAVPGQVKITSVSREGVSLVTIRFQWGTDMDFAMLNLREQLDNLREIFPTGVRPSILRVDPRSDPVMALSVAGSDLWETKQLAETVFRRRLEQLDGVAQAEVTGGLDREIRVEVNPRLLEAYGVTMEQVAQALAQANVSAPGGTILQGRFRYPLRTLGEFRTVAEIGDVAVGRQATGGGTPAGAGGEGQEGTFRLIRLRDVASVVDGYADRDAVARYGGAEAVGVLVFKESGANTVAVDEAVRGVLEQLAAEYPAVAVDVAHSQAEFISESISNVVQALVLGGLLAFLVLFFFLRDSRYPFAIATAIPVSVVGTFALMEAAGVSLNIMSLGGLALGVGMLVDNSIVVLENIFRHREAGKPMLEAAALGAEEVQGAITAATLTTISVFGPIVYVEGVAGELFGDLSLAVAFSLLVSLGVALTLLPSLAARFARAKAARTEPPPRPAPERAGVVGRVRGAARRTRWAAAWLVHAARTLALELVAFWWSSVGGVLSRLTAPLFRTFDRAFAAFAERYHRALGWALDHRARVLGLAGAALAVTVFLGLGLPRDLLPDVDQGAFEVRLVMPEGTGLAATLETAGGIEEALLADVGIAAVFSRVGRDVRAYAEGESETGLNTAVFQVRVADGHATGDVVGRLRPVAARYPLATVAFETGKATALGRVLGGGEADVAVRVRGEDLDEMFARAQEVRQRLVGLPQLANVRVGTAEGTPQIQVEILRDAAASYGLQPRRVAEAIDHAMRGNVATEFVDFDRKIAVTVNYPEELRYSRQTLETLRVDGVPLRELVRIEEALGPAEVHREDQGRLIPVYADVVRGGLDQAIAAIQTELGRLSPARGLVLDVGGENEEMRRSFRDLSFAFALALVLVYMILAAQFESFVHPFTILAAVPLSLVGAVLALLLTGQGVNTMSLIGLVILIGIVVNDAIVKVDFINQARRAGRGLRDAILEAGRVRLRPIVMTTVTTVLGLLPMALGIGRGADLRAPLAIAVIGGLIVATALTLLVVPVVYSVVEEARQLLAGERPAEAPGAVPVGVTEGGAA